jgi:hypothetical protein
MVNRGERNRKRGFSTGCTAWNKDVKFQNNDDSQGSSVKTVRLSTEMHEKVVNTSCIGVEPVIQGQVSQYRLLRPKRSVVDTIDDFCAEVKNYR